MRSFEILFESYPIARKKFSQVAPADEVNSALQTFKDLAQKNLIKGADKDLTTWIKAGWNEFSEFVQRASSKTSNRATKKSVKSDVIKLHDDENWLVVVPLTKAASQTYGRGSRWCTAATESENYFYSYFVEDKIVLFYFLHKTDSNKKIAAAYDQTGDYDIRYFDQDDEPLGETSVEEITGMPYIAERISQWIELFGPQIATAREEIAKFREAEKLKKALLSPDAAVRYAQSKDLSRFPEGEEIIATNVRASLEYAVYVLCARFPAGEKLIMQSPHNAYVYCSQLNFRWPEAEEAMLIKYKKELAETQDVDDISLTIARYAARIIDDKWPEAEQTFMSLFPDSIEGITRYSEYLDSERGIKTPEVDKFIIDKCILASDHLEVSELRKYVVDAKNRNWPEAEQVLLSGINKNNPTTVLKCIAYSLVVTGNRWTAFEPYLKYAEADKAAMYRKAFHLPEDGITQSGN